MTRLTQNLYREDTRFDVGMIFSYKLLAIMDLRSLLGQVFLGDGFTWAAKAVRFRLHVKLSALTKISA